MSKTNDGRYFEDFTLGEEIRHGVPRTLTEGDAALYQALTGSSFALQSSRIFARMVGYDQIPLDDMLLFNVVLGKTVRDLSLNAIGNLGYAECDFLTQVYVGETISARSTVIGLKENSDGDTGTVYVRTEGLDHRNVTILRFVRWFMVPKRKSGPPSTDAVVPELASVVDPLTIPRHRLNRNWDTALSGSPHFWEDYATGEKIDHHDGVTLEHAEHMMATRLYQNPSRIHYDAHMAQSSRFGQRIVYGGHVISLARALTVNGLANGCILSAIHGGRHVGPVFAGDTLYAWTEITAAQALDGRKDIGALRLRTTGVKNRSARHFPSKGEGVVLELDYTVLMPRRPQ